jgi:hypothetical protein
LFPAATTTKAMKMPFRDPKYAYSAEQINTFGANFRKIVPLANKLITEIGKRETSA